LNVGDIIYQTTGAKLSDTNGTIRFSPAFTYGGFQYCQLVLTAASGSGSSSSGRGGGDGADDKSSGFVATASSITVHFTHSDLPAVGQMMFNNGLLNTIQRMLHYTSLSNLQDIPTDCPTRERAGWTGDGTVRVFDIYFHSRMPLDPTHVRFK
jgi:alpha-L-rhamnosidase